MTGRPWAWARVSSPASTAPGWPAPRPTPSSCASTPKTLSLPFRADLGRPNRDNVIDGYINGNEEDVCADGIWQNYFTRQPDRLTEEDKREFLSKFDGVSLGSDAFFPFPDNIKRAKASGVKYIAQPGGSIRDDLVIEECDKDGMVMAFTGMRLFHH